MFAREKAKYGVSTVPSAYIFNTWWRKHGTFGFSVWYDLIPGVKAIAVNAVRARSSNEEALPEYENYCYVKLSVISISGLSFAMMLVSQK